MSSASGFEDDFTPFSMSSQASHRVETSLSIPNTSSRPESQAASEHSVLSQKPDNDYDKYAVFRELQMEEELIRAWRTPSEEEKENFENNQFVDAPEDPNDYEEPELLEEPPSHEPPQPVICSSEGSPVSQSDTQSPVKSMDKAEAEEVLEDLPNKRESQLPIYNENEDDESVTQSIKSANEDNFFKTPFGSEANSKMSNHWTTFEDDAPDLAPEMIKSKTAIYTHYNSENAFQDNFGDTDWGSAPFEAAEEEASITEVEISKPEPSAPVRQHSSESQHSNHSKCKRFSHRHADDDHICSRGHSLEAPEDISYNTDWWPPSAEVGAPIKKPPIVAKTGGTGNEAYSSTPDHTSHPREESNNVFAEPLEARFKIFSKVVNNGTSDRSLTPLSGFNDHMGSDNDSGIIPKSDSVNIFSIKDDPFDDDFFH